MIFPVSSSSRGMTVSREITFADEVWDHINFTESPDRRRKRCASRRLGSSFQKAHATSAKRLRRRISLACARLGVLESGFTVEPWPTMRSAESARSFRIAPSYGRRPATFVHPELVAFACECSGAAATVLPCAFALTKIPTSRSAKSGSASGPISTGWWGQFHRGRSDRTHAQRV